MPLLTKRATVYLDPSIHRALKLKSAQSDLSISELVNLAIRHDLLEDQKDLETFKKRAKEPVVSYEQVLKKLKADGKI